MTFEEGWKSPQWQRKAAAIKERAGWKCETCGHSDKQLSVHHDYYESGKDVWDYPDSSLRCLCNTCHKAVTVVDRSVKRMMTKMNMATRAKVLGFVWGIAFLEGIRHGFPILGPDFNSQIAKVLCIPVADLLKLASKEHMVYRSAIVDYIEAQHARQD